jgi:membrane-bound metal-dependent hydrolase YbcI (DUF457 family)
VEPITHALTSLAIARAAQKRLPRWGTAMVVVSGVAADLDFASYVGGPGAFLRFHRVVLHSLAGSAVMCCAIAWAFFAAAKRIPPKGGSPGGLPALRYVPAFAACAIGAGGHLLLDLGSGIGVQLLWPFHSGWDAWDLVANLDPWILIVLAAGLLLPQLFRLVSEEIGDRKEKAKGLTGAIVTLALVFAYGGARASLHSRAIDLLLSREYHGREPLSAGVFPLSSAPFEWHGVAMTDSTIETVEVPLGPGKEFDPDRSLTHYKPEDSPALEIAQKTGVAETFLGYARFPLASVIRVEDGYRVEVHDLRFDSSNTSWDNIFVRVDMDSALRVTRKEFDYASSPNP